jgi:hypothetical protein
MHSRIPTSRFAGIGIRIAASRRLVWLALLIVFAALFLLSLPLRADKKKAVNWMRRPGLVVRLETPLVVARQKCENWAWAAALETMLQVQDAGIAQEFWIQRINGGEVCLPRADSFENLARFLESGPYVLDNGRKVRLAVQYGEGAPNSPDDLIASVQRKSPIMLFWRGHPYVIAGVVYDEYLAPTGSRLFEVRELKLLDPFIDPSAGPAVSAKRTVFESRQEEAKPAAVCVTFATPPPSSPASQPVAGSQPATPLSDVPPAAPMERTASEANQNATKQPCVPEDPRIVSFVKGRDNPAEIDGTFQVRVVWQ